MILSSVHPEGQDADSGQCASAGELGMQRVFCEEVTALSGDLRLFEICVGDATEVLPAERVDLLPFLLRPLLRLTNRSIDSLPYTIRRVNLTDANCPPRRMDDVLDAVLAGEP